IGNASLLIVCILSFFIGGVIALQTGPLLVERGLASAVGGVVGISVCKELAPVMMSILIAGRIGSAMAAEIGSMRDPLSGTWTTTSAMNANHRNGTATLLPDG